MFYFLSECEENQVKDDEMAEFVSLFIWLKALKRASNQRNINGIAHRCREGKKLSHHLAFAAQRFVGGWRRANQAQVLWPKISFKKFLSFPFTLTRSSSITALSSPKANSSHTEKGWWTKEGDGCSRAKKKTTNTEEWQSFLSDNWSHKNVNKFIILSSSPASQNELKL